MYKVGMNTMLWTDNVSLAKDKALIEKIMGMGFDGVEFPVHAGMDIDEAKRLGAYMAEKAGNPLPWACSTLPWEI